MTRTSAPTFVPTRVVVDTKLTSVTLLKIRAALDAYLAADHAPARAAYRRHLQTLLVEHAEDLLACARLMREGACARQE